MVIYKYKYKMNLVQNNIRLYCVLNTLEYFWEWYQLFLLQTLQKLSSHRSNSKFASMGEVPSNISTANATERADNSIHPFASEQGDHRYLIKLFDTTFGYAT